MTEDDFKDRYGPVALITGASSGIGRSFAEQLAALRVDLVLVARRTQLLEELASDLRARHTVQVTICQTDLAGPGAAQKILDATASLDIGLLISNAGFSLKGAHAANDPKAMSDMLMVNCSSPMLLAHGFIPRLLKRGKGGLLFTSSVEALIGCPFSSAYSATKAMVKGLAEGLWGELSAQGIDVLAICPGATDTEALARSGVDRTKMQHVMSPDDVARMALENIANGPVLITSAHYKAIFEHLLSMPRREALLAMAKSMKS